MRNLEIYNLPLGDNIILERMDPRNPNHKNAVKEMRDFHGKRMMFDIKYEISKIKKNRNTGDSFFIKKVRSILVTFIYQIIIFSMMRVKWDFPC